MILQCPACDARFLIPDALVPREGRTVRCGKCKHEWHASPSPVPMDIPESAPAFASFEEALASATAEEAEIMAQSAAKPPRLPAVQKQPMGLAPFVWATGAFALLALLLAPLAFYPAWKDGPVGGIYRTIGWNGSDGLAFSDIDFAREQNGSMTKFNISGNITNRAGAERTVDIVRVVLKDENGNAIWTRKYNVDKTLAAGDIYPFSITNVETGYGDRVRTVMMDMGNAYEMMIR